MAKKKNIIVIDYGLGNLASVYNALIFLGARPKISSSPHDVEGADKLVLPGVGACGDAVRGLQKRALTAPLKKFLASGKPYLGICLGLQILFEVSDEGGAMGLAVFKGRVRRFPKESGIKIPHIGWNRVTESDGEKGGLMKGIDANSYFYFDHSYYAEPVDRNIIGATTDYGINFTSMIRKGAVYGVQFHPERSQKLGLKVLKNFIAL